MPLGATETGLGAVTARGWGQGSQARLAGLCWLDRAGAGWASLDRLDYKAVAGSEGWLATWVAGALLAGLLGLFPGLGGG